MSERDIVERLEDIRMMVNYGNGSVGDEPDPWAVEARAEILRLRAALAARAVPDEEAILACLQTLSAVHLQEGGPIPMVMTALRAAGLKVVRDV